MRKAIITFCLLLALSLASKTQDELRNKLAEGKLVTKEEKDCSVTLHAYLAYSLHNGHHFDPEFVNLFNNYVISSCRSLNLVEEVVVIVNNVAKNIGGMGCKEALMRLVEETPHLKILERGNGESIQTWKELHPLKVLEGLSGESKGRLLSLEETKSMGGGLNQKRLEKVISEFKAVSKIC